MEIVSIAGRNGTIELAGSGRVPLVDWTLAINFESLREWSGSFHLPQPVAATEWAAGDAMIELVTDDHPPAIWSGAVVVTPQEAEEPGALFRFTGANQLARREQPTREAAGG